MITIDEMEAILDEIATGFPRDLYKELNGGIILLPELKQNPAVDNLFILGEYYSGGTMGRYIAIYYGSFIKLYSNYNPEQMRQRLTQTLKHEFIHHVESLAGEKDLEKKDAQSLALYLTNFKKTI